MSKLARTLGLTIKCDFLVDSAFLRKHIEVGYVLDASIADDDRVEDGAYAESKSPFLLALDETRRDEMND